MTTRARGILYASIALVACSREAAPGPEVRDPDRLSAPARAPEAPPSPKPPASPPSVPAASASPGAPEVPAVMLTELAPTQGQLLPLLAMQVERAKGKGRVAVVEFYADWCPPCRTFQESLDDLRIREALRGALLVKLNMDDWHDKLKGTGFEVRAIPAFYLVSADGRPKGKMLDGDKWRRPTPETMAAGLTKLLAP